MSRSSWSRPDTVAGFAQSPPNPRLIALADSVTESERRGRVLDIGCGAGRNAVPLAVRGWDVVGTDLSRSMLRAAADRAVQERVASRVRLVEAPMDALPVADRTFDFIVAHGIWNLARSGEEFRTAIGEAARAAAPGALLFVFTFSRRTIPEAAAPISGETFVFTEFSGEPQCFLTEAQLVAELDRVGFSVLPDWPVRELNRRDRGSLVAGGAPVIFEAGFRYIGL